MNTNKKSSPKSGKSTKPAAAKSARAGKSSKPVTGKTQNSGKLAKSDGEKSVTARDKRKYIDFKIKVILTVSIGFLTSHCFSFSNLVSKYFISFF